MPKAVKQKYIVTIEVEVEAYNRVEAMSAVEDACQSYRKADIELVHTEVEEKF